MEEPVKISREVSGKNSITIFFFKKENRFVYDLQSLLGGRAYAIYHHTDSCTYESIIDAKSAALKKMESWAEKNSLIKQFNLCLGAFQPELF